MKKRFAVALFLTTALVGICCPVSGASLKTTIGVNVVLNADVTPAILADLGRHGTVRDVIYKINAVTLQTSSGELPAIQSLPYVAAANPDAVRTGVPIDTVSVTDFADGLNTWDLDAVNVTDFGSGRVIGYDGSGVFVAVLDTGLVDSWRHYFPEERIAEQYGICFGGGGGDAGWVSTQPDKWQRDQDSHGTHVTSTILGYQYGVNKINGAAPLATVIPVKVLSQNGSGWSSVIARGIIYVADLKASALAAAPVIINMSLGGSALDALEKAAIDYAIGKGVIIVASAGNRGTRGMGYPGGYEPVISSAASGWIGEWKPDDPYWWLRDVADPTNPDHFYIVDFSSRQKPGQDLDVAAPGSWVLGPYQVNGQISYYFLAGTSMASPHVAGIVALMAQKDPTLTASQAEAILEETAISLAPGCRTVYGPDGLPGEVCWGADATGAGLVDAAAALDNIKAPRRGK